MVFQKDIMDYLELKTLQYIIAAKFTHPIQHLIDQQDFWIKVDEGIEICDKYYQAKTGKARRIVIVRQKKSTTAECGIPNIKPVSGR